MRRQHFSIVPTTSIISLSLLSLASSHSRWSCPEPRNPSTGIKRGPCGDDTNDFSDNGGDIVEIKPGPLRVTFEESISHTGAPFRISLSNDGNDDDSCVLLDHIPHNDCCSPKIYDPTTYTPFAITINIPNVVCERCSLHLANPMTDKIGSAGSPSGIGCTDPGTCFSVYHSCTKPFRIVGDVDAGAVQRPDYTCPSFRLDSFNDGWPTTWTGDNEEDVDAGTPGVYRRESSIWSTEDYTLTTAPAQFREDVGGLCGAKAESIAPASSLVDAVSTKSTRGPTMSTTSHPTISPIATMIADEASPPSSAIVIATSPTAGPTTTTNQVNNQNPPTTSPTVANMGDETAELRPSSSTTPFGPLSLYGAICVSSMLFMVY